MEFSYIKEWDLLFFEFKDRFDIILDVIILFKKKYKVLPKLCNVFKMFRMIHPNNVRVVMIGQSPYPSVCRVTGIPYAYGPAFLPNPMCATTPLTLQHIGIELCRDLKINKIPKNISTLINNWIKQGVMLLNASMTLGVNCPTYLENHYVLWEELMRKIIFKLSTELAHSPIFVLIGKEAWKFQDCISTHVIKVSHPVSRGKASIPWIGSGIFTKINKILIEKNEKPIMWI